jgi:hypothetical protein
MSDPSLEAKKAYFAKMQRSNYAASLRLEGFTVKEGGVKHRSRKAAVLAHTRRVEAEG